MSIYTLMFIGTAPLGSLAAGWIAQHYGAPLSTSLSALTLEVYYRYLPLYKLDEAQKDATKAQ